MSLYRNWFLASRPWSFSMTAISISVGSALAAIDGSFSWIFYIVTILAGIFMHAATNLINDYYDVKNGLDTVEAATAQYRPHPLVAGLLPEEQVRWAAYGLFAVAAGGWWTIVSPLLMTFLLLRVSGVAYAEQAISERRVSFL